MRLGPITIINPADFFKRTVSSQSNGQESSYVIHFNMFYHTFIDAQGVATNDNKWRNK